MEETKTGVSKQNHGKRHRTHHSGKPNPYRRLESIVSKHLFKVIGILFILVVAVYSVGSLEKLKGVVKQLSSHENVIQLPGQSTVKDQLGGIKASAPATISFNPGDVRMMFIFASIISLFFAALLLFSIRIHRKEIPRISGAVFYALAFLLAGKYGWQIHVLFPMILIFSVLIFYSGIKLQSMVAVKWNLLICWGFFIIWWILKMILGGGEILLWGFFLYGSLFYLLFLWIGSHGGFTGHHKFSDYTETGLILFNITVFYLMGIVSLVKFGHIKYAWLFSLLIASINLMILLLASNSGKKLKSAPYVFPSMIIISLIFPFIFQASDVIIFLAVLSCLLLLYSKYSGDRVAVITALLSVVLMLLVYFKDWLFQYIPAAFLGNVLENPALMTKGLVAGLVIFPVMIINSRLIRRLHVDFSKEWFSRRSYLTLFKGINLIVLYLSGYWIVNYFVLVWSENPDLNFLSWFGYNCLFFLISIPILSAQKSKYLTSAIGFALFFSLAYPTLIHFTTLDVRNEILQHQHLSRLSFMFHYPIVILFVAELFLLFVYLRMTFSKNIILLRFFTIYLLLLGIFILLSEFDHYSIWTGLRRGITIEEIGLANRVIPYTVILLAYSSLILGVGMIFRIPLLRASGLVFLLATLIKMLYIDVRALSGTPRTIMLFTVGVIVLTLSFMYPRLKRYFRHREHEARGGSNRNRRHTHRKPVSMPDEHLKTTNDEAL